MGYQQGSMPCGGTVAAQTPVVPEYASSDCLKVNLLWEDILFDNAGRSCSETIVDDRGIAGLRAQLRISYFIDERSETEGVLLVHVNLVEGTLTVERSALLLEYVFDKKGCKTYFKWGLPNVVEPLRIYHQTVLTHILTQVETSFLDCMRHRIERRKTG